MNLSANAQLLLQRVAEFNTGNTAAMREVWAENGVWHAAGDNAASGDFVGRDACGRWFVDTAEILGGDCTVDPQDLLCDDDYVVFFNYVTARRGDAVLQQVHMNTWRFEDGLAVEGWFLPADVAEWDAFVGPRPPTPPAGASRARLVSRPRSAG